MGTVRRAMPPCGIRGCAASWGVGGLITFGRGKLSPSGYFSIPCGICARAYERLSPGEQAWPRPEPPRDPGRPTRG